MTERQQVGLTGGIATGKSTVSRWFILNGIPVIDLDAIVKRLQAPGTRVVWAIAALFPECVSRDGVLDRDRLGRRIFSNANERRKLNQLMRGPIQRAICTHLAAHWIRGSTLVVLDAPLLFETPALLRICALFIVVSAPSDMQLSRLCDRDGLSRQHAMHRIEAQMPLADKVARAHVVLDNSSDLDHLFSQCESALHLLQRRRALWWFCSLPGCACAASIVMLLVRFITPR